MTMTLGTHLNERNFLFTPRLANRTYTLQYSTDLLIWKELSGAIHDFPLGTASDPNASEARKFYRIGITFP